ncbi:unnamed protein product [Orchesella dallaii]|uniref:Uncharacterized protein n=1 Tax=Orchesella dallaii TaxID=48710 RepID=A0ABP1PTC8_9HEXA
MESHFMGQQATPQQTQSAPVPTQNSNFQPELQSRVNNGECSNSYLDISNNVPPTLNPTHNPPLETPEQVNHQEQTDERLGNEYDYTFLRQHFDHLTYHSCHVYSLLKSQENELASLRENKSSLTTELANLNQKCIDQHQEKLSLLAQIAKLKSTTVPKDQYDEVVVQNRTIGGYNIQLNDRNDKLKEQLKEVRLVKAEGGRLLQENRKLKNDVNELHEKLQNEKIKTGEAETNCKKIEAIELKLQEKINELQRRDESHQKKAKDLEEELSIMRDANKSEVQDWQNKLADADWQVIQANTRSTEKIASLNDKSQKLEVKVEELNCENSRLLKKVLELEDEIKAFANATEEEKNNWELVVQTKRSSELSTTVQEQSEELNKLKERLDEQNKTLQRKEYLVSKSKNEASKFKDNWMQNKNLVQHQQNQISELKLKITQLEKQAKEKEKKIDEQEKIIKGRSCQAPFLSKKPSNKDLHTVELRMELGKQKSQNGEPETSNLPKFLRQLARELTLLQNVVLFLQNMIESRDQGIRVEKSYIQSLLRGNLELETKFGAHPLSSSTEIATTCSLDSQGQAWENTKSKLFRRNKILQQRERARAAELRELEHVLVKKLGELNRATEAVVALNTQISGLENHGKTCIIKLCVKLQKLKSNRECMKLIVNQGQSTVPEQCERQPVGEVGGVDSLRKRPRLEGTFVSDKSSVRFFLEDDLSNNANVQLRSML